MHTIRFWNNLQELSAFNVQWLCFSCSEILVKFLWYSGVSGTVLQAIYFVQWIYQFKHKILPKTLINNIFALCKNLLCLCYELIAHNSPAMVDMVNNFYLYIFLHDSSRVWDMKTVSVLLNLKLYEITLNLYKLLRVNV